MTRAKPLAFMAGLALSTAAMAQDSCPSDPNKTAPGLCGCGVNDSDWSGDGEADSCIDPSVTLPVGTVVGLRARVDSGAVIQSGVTLGAYSHIGADASVGSDSFVGARARLGADASVGTDSIVGRNANIGPDAILGNDAVIGRSATIDGGFTVGSGGLLTLGYAAELLGAPTSVGTNVIIGNLASVEADTIADNVVISRSVGIEAGVTLGQGAVIGPEVDILQDAVIGSDVRLRKLSSVGEDSHVGANTRVGRGTTIQDRSCIGDNARLGANVTVQTWGDVADADVERSGTVVAGDSSPPDCLSIGSLSSVGGAFQWDDGTVASSCWFYRNPTDAHVYNGAGDGVYRVDPNGGSANDAFNVYCDMTTDGGGWTLVDNDPTNAATFTSRTSGTITNPSQAGGRLLPDYAWSNDPLLLCKSNRFTGSVGWLTLRAGGTIALQYPTAITQGRNHVAGWAPETLNGNTNRGMTSWIYSANSRFGSVWIGAGNNSTCSCNYTGNSSGLGTYGASNTSTCSTWVR